ncbi:MAG: hypothetical protein JRJ11_05350 [Deltaproteobacteria bacterium]|nr:hypothetical protein [Deltaproteobacteria bacterium]
MRVPIRSKLFCLLASLIAFNAWAGEYDFDIPDIEKKPYEFGGSIKAEYVLSGLNEDSTQYHQKFYNRDEGSTLHAYGFNLQLEGSYQIGIAKFYAKGNTDLTHDYLGWEEDTSLYEGFVSIKPAPSFTLEAGKKVMKWGKGYAWNPVAFTSRPKDPDDPEQSLEGYTLASVDLIKSMSGPIQTIALTPVLFPVYEEINNKYGETGHINFAGKLYLLILDTDIDFMIFTGKSKEDSYGVDFSRNIMTNFEIHGEAVFIHEYEKQYIDRDGVQYSRRSDEISYLFGLRYLNKYDTTFIVEYYRNGKGFSEEEMTEYFKFTENAYNTYLLTGNEKKLKKSLSLSKYYFSEKNFMKDYIYFKATQKEPFDILYFNPSLAVMFNVADTSCSITPELLYTPISNLELRLKSTFFQGSSYSEFGEKPFDYKVEFYVKYYF